MSSRLIPPVAYDFDPIYTYDLNGKGT